MSRRYDRLEILPATVGALLAVLAAVVQAQGANPPVNAAQRDTAQQVAQAGVPLSALAAGAPDSYTVKAGDTLWDISRLFLTTPWRWPELWGMNLKDIRNPHLIYPGQTLYLDRSGDRAQLRIARPVAPPSPEPAGAAAAAAAAEEPPAQKLSPRIRESAVAPTAIASVPVHLIAPFLNNAVIFETDQLDAAPRIVAAPEARVILTKGDTAYVRGEVAETRNWHLYRQPRPLIDPTSGEVLGYEARHVGAAELVRAGSQQTDAAGKPMVVPATVVVTQVREEVMVGDRLAIAPPRDYNNFAPHAPSGPLSGQIVSLYGDALSAGQSQIVSINRGLRDGVERGHVLALWHDGALQVDPTDPEKAVLQLPQERRGLLFVFNVFERMSYALILQTRDPVHPGSRFGQP